MTIRQRLCIQGPQKRLLRQLSIHPDMFTRQSPPTGWKMSWRLSPPQVDINVGMISKASPTVLDTVVYSDCVKIKFSQFMNIDSVVEALSVAMGGKDIAVSVSAKDAEYNAEGTGQYAIRFKAVLKSKKPAGKVAVKISESAKNYAGKRSELRIHRPKRNLF